MVQFFFILESIVLDPENGKLWNIDRAAWKFLFCFFVSLVKRKGLKGMGLCLLICSSLASIWQSKGCARAGNWIPLLCRFWGWLGCKVYIFGNLDWQVGLHKVHMHIAPHMLNAFITFKYLAEWPKFVGNYVYITTECLAFANGALLWIRPLKQRKDETDSLNYWQTQCQMPQWEIGIRNWKLEQISLSSHRQSWIWYTFPR